MVFGRLVTPSRFPSKDKITPESQRLRDAFHDSLEHLTVASPEIVGGTLFGSSARGTAERSSDVDGFVFVDIDLLQDGPERREVLCADSAERIANTWGDLGRSVFGRSPKVREGSLRLAAGEQDTYQSMVRHEILDRLGSRDAGLVENVSVMPISEGTLTALVKHLSTWHLVLQPRRIIYDRFDKKQRPQITMPTWAYYLSALFMADTYLGKSASPLNTYRIHTLEELAKFGEKGDRIWQQVVKQLRIFENPNHGKWFAKSPEYPDTVADALAYYRGPHE